MNEPIEAPNTEAMSDLHCASCPAALEVTPGVDQRGQLCAACNFKLQALIDDPVPPPLPPNPPSDTSGPVPAVPLRDAVLAASAEKAPELEKALEEAKAVEHANYCKTKATEPGACSCGADPSVPVVEEPAAPVAPRVDPILMTEAEAKEIKSVDLMGNGPGYVINDHVTGRIIPYASGLQVAFMPSGVAAVFGVPTAFLDPPEVPPQQRRIQITTVRCVVAKLMMCSRPSAVRLKNKGDEWWGAATSMLHTLDDTDRFEYVTAPPEVTADVPASPEATDGQVDPPASPEPQS
jgi:hypothetical protein